MLDLSSEIQTKQYLKEDVKKKWVEKLRSGNYYQTTGALKRDFEPHSTKHPKSAGYCCLGVLADIYLSEHNESWIPAPVDPKHPAYGCCSLHTEGNFGVLNSTVKNWATEIKEYTNTKNPFDDHILMDLNDRGFNFNQIADYIEEHF